MSVRLQESRQRTVHIFWSILFTHRIGGKAMDQQMTQREFFIGAHVFGVAFALMNAWFFSPYWLLAAAWGSFMLWALYRRRWIFR